MNDKAYTVTKMYSKRRVVFTFLRRKRDSRPRVGDPYSYDLINLAPFASRLPTTCTFFSLSHTRVSMKPNDIPKDPTDNCRRYEGSS